MPLKLLRQTPPDPQQLALQLDFFPRPPHRSPRSISNRRGPSSRPPPIDAPQPFPVPAGGDAATQRRRRLQVGNHLLEYRLLRSKRRTIGFLIDDDGLRITAPRWVTIAEIESAIREKQRWIFGKLTERRERSARRLQPQMQWVDGATLPYLGADLTLRILSAQGSGIAWCETERELTVSLPPDAGEQQLKDRVQGWLQGEAKRIFGERLPVYAEKLGVRYQSYALSSATTQWGSCTVEGRIRLNWRLIHFSLPLIDYVIAHELSHLREMNHSPRFWATVQSIFPEFEPPGAACATAAPKPFPSSEDNIMRILHTMLRVGDLQRSIDFYTRVLGMKLLRTTDRPEQQYSLAFLGYGTNPDHAEIELTYNYGVDKYELGTAYGHIAIAVEDAYKTCELVKAQGGNVTREAGPVKGGKTVIAFVQDPDGYKIELIERGVD